MFLLLFSLILFFSLFRFFLFLFLTLSTTYWLILKALIFIGLTLHSFSIKISVFFGIIVIPNNLRFGFLNIFLHLNFYVLRFKILYQNLQLVSLYAHKLNSFFLFKKSNFHVKLLIVGSKSIKFNFFYLLNFKVKHRFWYKYKRSF